MLYRKKTTFKSIVVTLFLLLCILKGTAQVNAYTFTQVVATYVPLTGIPATAYTAPWDDHVSGAAFQATIPFSFVFDGISYTQCFISPNGFITFGATQPATNNYTPISTGAQAGAIAALGLDLISNGAPIQYDVVGTAPNRTFVIQWTNAVRKSQTGNFNFQIRLNETLNTVDLSYGLCQPAGAVDVLCQVGLRGPNATAAQGNISNRYLSYGTNWLNNTTTLTTSVNTLVTSPVGYPDNGLDYKYIPSSPCAAPSALPTSLIVGGIAITNTAFTGNSFTAPSPAPTNYLILRSTVNVAPTIANIVNRTYYITGTTYGNYLVLANATTTTFTQTGLAAATRYYYWIIPYNDKCTGAPFYNLTTVLTANAITCFTPTVALAASAVGGNNFTANWTAVASATGYALDVSTNATFTAMLPGYNNLLLGSGVTSLVLNGLLPSTTYYYRVRAFSGVATCLINSATITATTTCGYYTIPYLQNFDSFATGVLPTCYARVDGNSDGFQWETQDINYSSASRSLFMGKNATVAMDDWFFTPGLNLTGGTSYRLFFRYNTGNASTFLENLKVRLGTGAAIASMTETLIDLPNLNNSVFQVAVVDFLPVTSGIYYIGFQGYSAPNQSYLVVDDVSVTVSPNCFEPTDVTATAIGSTDMTLTWTDASPSPANGYEYYVSTSSTPPIGSTVPTGSVGAGITSVLVSGLLPSTYYYVWVRGNCTTVDKSIWSIEETFNTECTTPVIASTTNAARCGNGSVVLQATTGSGALVNWFATTTDTVILASGTNFTTPSISNTTTYYAEAKSFGAVAKVGPANPTTQGGILGIQNYQASVNFNITSNTSLLSVDLFPITSGQPGQLVLRNSSNILIAAFPFTTNVSGGSTAQVIPINYLFVPGSYSLYFSIMPAAGVRMNTTNAFYPMASSVANILSNTYDNTLYLGIYNWKFTTECLSARVPVTATVSIPPVISISATDSTICDGTVTPLITVSGYAAYNSLVWTPSTGISGSFATGFIFNPTTTTVYTLTANQTSGTLCGNIVTHTVTVLQSPPAVVITPSVVTVCQNNIQPLNAGSGSSVTVPVFTENFNAATTTWTAANTSIGGDTDASQWTPRPNNYNYINSFGWNVTFSSNDASKFYMANSDSQSGVPGIVTRTTLTSPSINLAGYTSANLSFYHYYRFIVGDLALVEISIDGGTNWTTLKAYNASQGAVNAFANDNINLDPYLGNINVKLRYNFSSFWGYVWAIDNIKVTGVLATAMTWSPVTDLYTDAAATIPYVAGTPLGVVYSKPTASVTYTATITGANGCFRSGTSVITVAPNTTAGVVSSDQIICNGGVASSLTLTGAIGSILRWEYADDAAFTINVISVPNTTTTLTALQMGSYSTIRYFRAVVKNGGCNQLYTNVVYISFPSTTWDGTIWSNGVPNANVRAIIAGNYNSTGDLYACSLKVTSGTVVFNANHSLVVTNDVFVSGGSLTFENNASLVQINNAVNTGNGTFKRITNPMKRYDFTYWSTPVFPQTLVGLSPLTLADKYFKYDPTIPNWVAVSGNNLMDIGKGYIIRAPNNFDLNFTTPFNAVFVGVPNNGIYTTPIQVSLDTMNLIGNPYPSALSADLFLSDPLNTAVVDATIYLWTHNTPVTAGQYTSNDYAAYNYLGGTGTASANNSGINNTLPNGKIASGQSFFIKGLTNGNVTFLNSMRLIGNNNQFFRIPNQADAAVVEDKNRIWLDVVDAQGTYKQTLVGYAANATLGIDRGYDGAFLNIGNAVSLYSLSNTTPLTIQGRPLPFTDADEVPLGFYAATAGNFTISLFSFDGLFLNQNIYLKDTQTNTIFDLKQASYSFASNAGTFNSRFVLVYNNNRLTTNTSDFNANAIVLYKPDQYLHIDTGRVLMKEIKIYDIRGRVLYQKSVDHLASTAIAIGTTTQVVLVEITSEDGVVVTKKYVN